MGLVSFWLSIASGPRYFCGTWVIFSEKCARSGWYDGPDGSDGYGWFDGSDGYGWSGCYG